MAARQQLHQDADLYIDGKAYMLFREGESAAHTVKAVPVQPGEMDTEFERRLVNLAIGWGMSRYEGPGGYDYADSGVLHRRGSWLPGALVTAYTPATAPDGPCSFVEYWDGTAANRRLLIVTSRYVYEINSAGTISTNDLTALVPVGVKMTKGVRYKAPTAMASPRVFIAVQNGGATDYFITRTAVNTYVETAALKRAIAIAVGKDTEGEPVLWRVDENGKLQVTTADSDPDVAGSWAGATYPVGETSVLTNDLFMQGRKLLVGRVDGAWTFDTITNSIPITRGLEQTPDDENFRYFKDFNGLAVAPTVQGLVWIDGLEWEVVGPASSNPDARNLRGREVGVSAQAGRYIYCAVFFGSNSYIFMGEPREGADQGVGSGPFVWHGPVAVVPYEITDLIVSTVYGTRLWWGADGKFGDIQLESDFSPKKDLSTGYIYLPDGVLDFDGPGVIKDFRKVEFVSSPSVPFSSTNQWTLELDLGAGYVAVDGGNVVAGTYAERFWTTETSTRSPKARLKYAGNTGAAELWSATVRGTHRPETTDEHTFTVIAQEVQRTARGTPTWRSPMGVQADARALVDAGRKTVVAFGSDSFTGKVTNVGETRVRQGEHEATRVFDVTVRKVKTS